MLTHTPTPSDRLLLRPVEAAERLGVSLRSLMTWTAAGEIPAIRVGTRCLRFSVTDLQDWIDGHRISVRPAAGGDGNGGQRQ